MPASQALISSDCESVRVKVLTISSCILLTTALLPVKVETALVMVT